MTSSVSGQGAFLPARDTGFVLPGKSIMFWCFIPYNKSLIDQACLVKMAEYWPCSCLSVYGPRRSRGPCKKRTWPISNHLDLMLDQ